MLFLRVVGLFAAAGLGVLVLLYFVTSDRRYLQYAWRLFRYAVFLLALVMLLFLLERLIALA
jgi:hypothetical protein